MHEWQPLMFSQKPVHGKYRSIPDEGRLHGVGDVLLALHDVALLQVHIRVHHVRPQPVVHLQPQSCTLIAPQALTIAGTMLWVFRPALTCTRAGTEGVDAITLGMCCV